jgi:hypothetical protein
MKCPTCGENTPDEGWQWMSYTAVRRHAQQESRGQPRSDPEFPDRDETDQKGSERSPIDSVGVAWMRCANSVCRELVLRISEGERVFGAMGVPLMSRRDWIARPRTGASRLIDPNIPDPYRMDFAEAADVLNRSPRLSAVMSRRILADLLKDYAGLTDYDLSDRVRKAVNDRDIPKNIRDNLEEFLQVGNYGAHRKEGRHHDEDVILNVSAAEAEWLLDLLDRMFGHFIVSKAKDDAMKKLLAHKKSIELPEPKKHT